MGDKLIMNANERKRKVVMESIISGHYNLAEGAKRLEISYRQAKRIKARYLHAGDAGLLHKARGISSPRALPNAFKEKVLMLYQTKYMGFGPTFAAEKLKEEDDCDVHRETLRLWLKAAGLWARQRKHNAHRSRRVRRDSFGELLQIDGSHHDWFGTGEHYDCLLNIVDDATGKTLSQMDTGETCRILLMTFKWWVERYGVPLAVYVDLKNIYVSPKRLKCRTEDNLSEDFWNVFERICKTLDVKIIKAYSAQAKGRVERNHGVYQDRFVKELKLRDIKTIEGANHYLRETYLDKINDKFEKAAKSSENKHRPIKSYGDLSQIFCWEYERTLSNDFIIRFKNRFFQLEKNQAIHLRPKNKLHVRIHLDNQISLWYEKTQLTYRELEEAPVKKDVEKVKKVYTSSTRSVNARENKSKTPWSKFDSNWLKKKRSTESIQVNVG